MHQVKKCNLNVIKFMQLFYKHFPNDAIKIFSRKSRTETNFFPKENNQNSFRTPQPGKHAGYELGLQNKVKTSLSLREGFLRPFPCALFLESPSPLPSVLSESC